MEKFIIITAILACFSFLSIVISLIILNRSIKKYYDEIEELQTKWEANLKDLENLKKGAAQYIVDNSQN